MPRLTPLLQAQRQAQTLDALALITVNKLSVEQACSQVGISAKQYYFWLAKSEDAVEKFREAIQELSRMELAQMVSASAYLTEMLIDDALSPGTDAMYRLAIKKYMDDRIEKLADLNRARGNDAAKEFLTGVKLIQAPSRFTSTTVETSPNGTVKVTVSPTDIIDGSVVDDQLPASDNKMESPEDLDLPKSQPANRPSLVELGRNSGPVDDLLKQIEKNMNSQEEATPFLRGTQP